MQTDHEVGVDEVQRKLSDWLGPSYRVAVTSSSTLKVGPRGLIPAKIQLTKADGVTTCRLRTTGLLLSRLTQAVTVLPRVRRALEESFPSSDTS
ncbi:MAG TPA: hypothetical protein VK277_11595 [Acidimicrobiales bacterium]|nr:hypothetical protein [Acidimicrobiales bacterium]